MEALKITNAKFESLATRRLEPKKLAWWRLGLLTASAAYFYVFMEWLFFVTKPSFMDVMSLGPKFEVLFITSLFIIVLCLPAIVILCALSYLPWLSRRWVWFLYAGVLLPAGILTAASLLLIDNFTYTLFRWGVVSTQGAWRGLYGALFLVAFLLWYRWLFQYLRSRLDTTQAGRPLLAASTLGAVVIIISCALALANLDLFPNPNQAAEVGNNTRRPNILLLGGDGLNAANMSVYGYERDTTPNLRLFAKSSLVAENAFTNSANSPGSIISIMTGKHPLNTRVVYPPDILRGSDAYQHLPGILRSLGYKNIEIGVSHYIDVYNLNLRDGFDIVNNRSIEQAGFLVFTQHIGLQDSGYFSSVLVERLSDRIRHIFWLKEMENPYLEVTETKSKTTDEQKIRRLLNNLKQANQPLFVHVHLMGTHGPTFAPQKQFFSDGQTQATDWMPDFYDDAILDFDAFFGKVWSELTKSGLLEDTIVIIYSDHAQTWAVDQSIPLIMRFPQGEHAGRLHNNTQNMDIAPTILDYMGLPVPEWMEGQSLLAGEPNPTRPIYATGAYNLAITTKGSWKIVTERLKPPFYQFEFLQTIVCQNWYNISFRDYTWSQGEIQGYSAPCVDKDLPDTRAAQDLILQRLEHDGFNTTALKTPFAIHPTD